MSIFDFIKNFEKVEICNLTSDGIEESGLLWHETKVSGSWVEGVYLHFVFTKNRINCGKKQQVLRDDFNTQKFRSYKSFLI
jgi:hypothetical protein